MRMILSESDASVMCGALPLNKQKLNQAAQTECCFYPAAECAYFARFCVSPKQTATMASYQAAVPLSLLKLSLEHHYCRAYFLSSAFE